ncbi:MAG TPA: NAD(P)-dependent oxidoreductase [Pyrinomonadaceae bacterium]|jgi:hypothetical protein|nr:NAD(P)-dependent oxidoreductase [Pyrinomonadaceae bacterium]
MEVTQALVSRAQAANFEFGADTALVVVQHMLLQTVDLLRAVAAMGQRLDNVFALGKMYSNSLPVIQTIREMGVTVTESTMPEPGKFKECFAQDIKQLWEVAGQGLAQRNIKRIIVLDDAGGCISNSPPELLKQYNVFGVEQTSHGVFVFQERPPAFGVISWARTAVKLQIGGPIFSHCLIDKLNREFLNGKPLQGRAIGIIGLGSIGSGMANLTARQGNKVVFYDPDPDLPIPRSLQGRAVRLDSLEELMMRCEYVFGCTGRNPFKNNWPMAHRPGIKLFSGSSGDQEFVPIITDLKGKPSFKIACDSWDISSDDGPCGPILVAYYGYPYNFASRQGEAVPTHIVQLETGGLLAGLMQARIHLALCEKGHEQNIGIHRMSPEAQRFVYKTWLRAMRNRSIDVRERYGYDSEIFRAASYGKWFVDNTEPHPDASYEPASRTEEAMRQIFGNFTGC